MIEQANRILNKCGGLPLVISTIGSFLATKPKTAMEWRNLNKHISAELHVNPELGMMKTVLISSYEGLPYHLKLPFLYFSIFPEDRDITWARLVRRWIAEGYPKEVRNKPAEEIGSSYITDLINRSMVRPSKRTGHSTIWIGFLHNLIRKIAISKSTEDNLVFTLDEGCNLKTQVGKVRHLAVSNSWLRDKNAFEGAARNWSHVRSLTVFGEWKSFFISDNMRLLRVLDLEDTKGLEDDDLHQIVKLFHLKYLSLRRCCGLLRLPYSLGNLRHLETLDVRHTQVINLPSTIIKLQKLEYLHVGFIPCYDENEGRGRLHLGLGNMFCCSSKCWCCCWPVCLFSLLGVLLRMLYLLGLVPWLLMTDGFNGLRAEFMGVVQRGVKFPRGIRELKALHTVGVVNIDGDNAIIEDLQYLTDLRKLRVTGLNKKNCKKFFRSIAQLKCLEYLCVRSEGKPGLSDCLDDVLEFQENLLNLRSLKLYGYLIKLPRWIEELKNLVKLELRSSRISDVSATMKVLGKLPNLSILRLSVCPFGDQNVHLKFHRESHSTFPSLVSLQLYYQSNLKLVEFEERATPKLELLQFNNSLVRWKHPEVSLFSGLQSVKSLKEVQLIGNYEEDFVEGLWCQLPPHSVLKRCQAPK